MTRPDQPTAKEPLPRRMLLVRLGAIGDVTNALVVATAIKEADADVHVAWAVHPLSLPLVQGHPAIDRVHLWPRNSGVGGLRALVGEVREARYDAALDLQRIQKSALLARLSGARRVLGFDRARSKELSWLWTGERIDGGPVREHMVDQYMRFVRRLGVDGASPRRALPEVPDAAAWAESLVERLGRPPVLVNLGASKPENRWSVASFREFIGRWTGDGSRPPLVLTGGPADRSTADEIGMDREVHDVVGGTSLPQLWELARRSRAMVACDTGPMHLCAAVGTPVLALFAPSDAARTGPYGRGHVVLTPAGTLERDVTVAPEGLFHGATMAEIDPSDVASQLDRLLAGA